MENEAARREEDVERIRLLLTEERKLWSRPSTELVSDRVEEMCYGWKPVRPSATYNLRKPATNIRRKAAAATLNAASSTLSVNSKYDKSLEKRSYMSGELDENYSYVYRGGLSSRTTDEAGAVYRESQRSILDFHFSSPPRRHVQTVTLEPSAAHEASVHALAHCRDELSRILALQLKPELLVEQLIIENRLRTMSLAAFPVLEAGGSSPSPKRSGRAYSHSTPSLGTLPNTHVDYRRQKHKRASRHRTAAARRKAKEPYLQWCDSLSSHRNHTDGVPTHWPLPEVSHYPSALHRRRSQPSHNTKPTSHPTATFTNDATNEPSTRYRLPIVSPTLAAPEVSNSQPKTSTPRHTLLYKPEGSSKHHKSSSLAKSSSFYYPSVSYSNSKHMKHNLE